MNFSTYLRQIPDYPKKGIIFQDITTLLCDATAFRMAVDAMAERYRNMGISKVVSLEARGFLLGSALAYSLGAGLAPIRKKGKLPWKTYCAEYDLEYGSDAVEIHQDALLPSDNILVFDDMLATGGTAKAALELVRRFGVPNERIHLCFLMDIADVSGPAKEEVKQHGYFALI